MLLALLGVVLCGYSLIDGAQALSACPLITAQGYVSDHQRVLRAFALCSLACWHQL